MADFKEIVRLAVDTYHGRQQKYSKQDSLDVLRKALIDANGGSTALNYKALRDGGPNGLFALIEEILSRTVAEGLQGDEFFNQMVEYRNVAEGDKNEFVVEDHDLFIVSDSAKGVHGIRRQRIGGATKVSIPTVFKTVRFYEELNRVLAGLVDLNTFIQRVAESFRQKLLNDMYAAWNNATADDFGGNTYFPVAGSYDEDTLIEQIAHIEAAAGGKTATLLGTRKAIRNLAPAIQGSESKSDLYNLGLNIA